jgi:hypothetical protein
MDIANDEEYNILLEQLITKKENEYGNGWAKEWGAIRKMEIEIYKYWYNNEGRDFAIEKIKHRLKK